MKYLLTLSVDVRDYPYMTRDDFIGAVERMVKHHVEYDKRDIRSVDIVYIMEEESGKNLTGTLG